MTQAEWQGERLAPEQRLIVRFDAPDPLDERAHGFGDAFMAARFIPPLLAWAGQQRTQISFVVPPALMGLFAQSFPSAQLVTTTTAPSIRALDRWGYGMWHQCEQRLRLRPTWPYLVARAPWSFDPSYLHVGLCSHGGNEEHKRGWDATRSIHDPRLIEPLFRVPGVIWHWLEVEHAPPPLHVVDHRAALRSWTSTADLIAGLDAVITVDTAVAHLAGALGRPTWVLLRPPLPTGTRMTPAVTRDATYGDQRWNPIAICDGVIAQAPSRDPLYPTARLFHQPAPGDWAAVIDTVRHTLQEKLP